MIEYPNQYLPLPQITGYVLSTESPLQRSQLQSGRARQRRRFTSVPVAVTATWRMTHNQGAWFEAWFQSALKDGALWFLANLQTPKDAGGLAPYECRFTDIYDGPTLLQGVLWEYTAMLELRQRPLIPVEWVEFPDFWFEGNIIDMAMNREWPEV
ncbi:hypothetical protein IB274_25200 [Pseudomonas sp. PDM18]|uniref:hypothetical protein n=1 Tax=Pseudomonas sp. PDM18 TaxID=2769253 RepID=UPI0017843164|nr:hypothetical protein [Pseudomonas sp. PDM18]MBD9680027.1 hypothetical protein [Pseudomonas sp. PDM18]